MCACVWCTSMGPISLCLAALVRLEGRCAHKVLNFFKGAVHCADIGAEHNCLGFALGDNDAQAVAEALKQNDTVTSLDLSRNLV